MKERGEGGDGKGPRPCVIPPGLFRPIGVPLRPTPPGALGLGLRAPPPSPPARRSGGGAGQAADAPPDALRSSRARLPGATASRAVLRWLHVSAGVEAWAMEGRVGPAGESCAAAAPMNSPVGAKHRGVSLQRVIYGEGDGRCNGDPPCVSECNSGGGAPCRGRSEFLKCQSGCLGGRKTLWRALGPLSPRSRRAIPGPCETPSLSPPAQLKSLRGAQKFYLYEHASYSRSDSV